MSSNLTFCPAGVWTTLWNAPSGPVGLFTLYAGGPGKVDWQAVGPAFPFVTSGTLQVGGVDGVNFEGLPASPYVHITVRPQGRANQCRVAIAT